MIKPLSHTILIKQVGRFITQNLKDRSDIILRLWADHCEYILAQRFRRGQQMVSHYAKIWEERALKELFYRFKRQIHRHAKGIMFGSVGLYTFDWDSERISYQSIKSHYDEIEYVWKLQKGIIICSVCNKRKVIDCKVEGIEYCVCSKELRKHCNKITSIDNWKPYLERKNMVVWRREESPGLFAYKVHASYPDISAEDFLFVQTDVEYRKIWDKSAVSLEIIDTDPIHKRKSHVIYWEMQWPKLFANRDYVYQRRFYVDRYKKLMIIVSESIQHPQCPVKPNNQRVHEYWSHMVIKPIDNFKKPGLEYVLTYFDNPGIILPPAITSWVAQKQMPDFLNKLYCATLDYAQAKKEETVTIHPWELITDPGFEYPPDPIPTFGENNDGDKVNGPDNGDDNSDSDDQDNSDSQANGENVQTETRWWSYLLPHHYFA